MKKMNQFWVMFTLVFAAMACSTDDGWYGEGWTNQGNSTSSTTSESNDDNSNSTSTADDVITGVTSDGDVTSFTIALDKNALSESVNVDTNDDDYIENTTFDKTITVTFSQSGNASVSGDESGIVSINGNDVIATNNTDQVIKYVLTGETSDGFFKLYSTKKQAIVLNSVSITNLMAPPSTTKARSAPSSYSTTVQKII